MTAGRPKKIIKKSDLYNFLYTQKEELFITPKLTKITNHAKKFF